MLWQSPNPNDAAVVVPPRRTAPRSLASIWLLAVALWVFLAGLSLALWWTDVRNHTLPGVTPVAVLCGSLAVSVCMGATVLQMLLSRARAQEQAQRHLEAIESLDAISTSISGQLGSGNALHQLAEAAGKLLAMDRSGVCLLDETHRTLEVIAAAGDMPGKFPTRFDLDELPACDYSVRTNSVVFEEDIRSVTRPYNLDAVRLFGVVSMILIPLQIEGHPIGLLTLSSSHPKRFTDLNRRIAELLASQASVILANARLLEQTRRDAQAKAALLRELNHRVKNNLTGIVALLDMNVPRMSPEVRAWLDRATDRIRAMAGAHQLFTGGMEAVGLAELVTQTLSGLSVSKPPGVTVNVDLGGINVSLGSEQTIGLAMVLHELCFNAMVHGLSEGGVLTIRARKSNDVISADHSSSSVIIEVVDDGLGHNGIHERKANYAAESMKLGGVNHTGQGLGLVEGLVKRELRGRFELRLRNEGGTIATVEFPLNGAER